MLARAVSTVSRDAGGARGGGGGNGLTLHVVGSPSATTVPTFAATGDARAGVAGGDAGVRVPVPDPVAAGAGTVGGPYGPGDRAGERDGEAGAADAVERA